MLSVARGPRQGRAPRPAGGSLCEATKMRWAIALLIGPASLGHVIALKGEAPVAP
jgi:hypothetical protein